MNKFITVPQVTLPNGHIEPSFRVGQFACSEGEDGKAVITEEGTPWSRINYFEAKEACRAIDCELITELQWLAIAHDVATQDCNWTGGKVGEGKIFQGIHKGNVSEAQAGNYESSDPEERSWHQLSNGERIYHFAGNCFSWVFDDVQGTADGLTGRIAADSPSITTPQFPSCENGIGDYEVWDWSGGALIRGGCFGGSRSGVFFLYYGNPGDRYGNVGFRCTSKGL